MLYRFLGGSDGWNPNGNLAIGSSGVLYGTTVQGGSSSLGTVYSLKPPQSPGGSWTETVLYSFGSGNDGNTAFAGVVIGAGGVLYGTTQDGGSFTAGTVFSLTPPTRSEQYCDRRWRSALRHHESRRDHFGGWHRILLAATGLAGRSLDETVVHSFGSGLDGSSPFAGVVVGPGGVLFGTTQYSAAEGSPSTAFSLTPPISPGGPWTENILHYFDRGNGGGNDILSGLAVGRNHILYGTAYAGGTSHGGTVFALQP